MYKFGNRSNKNLAEGHADIVAVAHRALEIAFEKGLPDFGIIDCGRTLQEQKDFKAAGKSWTLKSRHRFAWPLTPKGNRSKKFTQPVAHAIDFMAYVGGKACWEFPVYEKLWKEAWKPAAAEMGVAVKWGGSWKSKDGPHVQLTWADYPAEYA